MALAETLEQSNVIYLELHTLDDDTTAPTPQVEWLRELDALRDEGYISEVEYQERRVPLVDQDGRRPQVSVSGTQLRSTFVVPPEEESSHKWRNRLMVGVGGIAAIALAVAGASYLFNG